MNFLQTQEQRRLLRKELLREKLNTVEGVFLARSQSSYKAKKKGWKNEKVKQYIRKKTYKPTALRF